MGREGGAGTNIGGASCLQIERGGKWMRVASYSYPDQHVVLEESVGVRLQLYTYMYTVSAVYIGILGVKAMYTTIM